jgi:hypothetical protein
MVVQCSVEEVTKVINYARKSKLYYLLIEKKDNILIMDYRLIDDIKKEDDKDRIQYVLDRSIKTTFDVINKLTQLNNILSNDIQPTIYSLCYECSVNSNAPTFSSSIVVPSEATKQDSKEVNIDWDEVFADKLDDNINGLYVKKSAKKYVQATYKDLVDVLRN